jgi:hypothetical protein
LPNRRVELYREAVRVLVRTWNTEGFEPMDLDETVAQLSYVACTMMNEGVQQVGHRRLLKLLQDAREELQAELQFCRVSPAEFIERVEYRSSLLMQTGHERIDGGLQPVYEFRHLTFQEYLAARGLVEEQYPGRNASRSLVDLLEPHFSDERWREVVPLAAVLAGRKAEPIISRLTAICEARKRERDYLRPEDISDPRVILLRQCLLDEVQLVPSTLRAALVQMARHGGEEPQTGSVVSLRRGKFGEVFNEVTEEAYFGDRPDWDQYSSALAGLAMEAAFRGQSWQLSKEVVDRLGRSLALGNRREQARASFVLMWLAYQQVTGAVGREPLVEHCCELFGALGRLLSPADPRLALAAAWALAWMGTARLTGTPPEPAIILSLYRLWREAESRELRRFSAWAFSAQPLLPRDTFPVDIWGDCGEWLVKTAHEADPNAPLVLAWYCRSPWNDSELADKASKTGQRTASSITTIREMLATLGEPGRHALEQLDKTEQQRSGTTAK